MPSDAVPTVEHSSHTESDPEQDTLLQRAKESDTESSTEEEPEDQTTVPRVEQACSSFSVRFSAYLMQRVEFQPSSKLPCRSAPDEDCSACPEPGARSTSHRINQPLPSGLPKRRREVPIRPVQRRPRRRIRR